MLELGEIRRPAGVRKLVVCSDCGGLYEVAPRTLREMAQQERLPKCPQCRRPMEIIVTNAEKLFQLERFTFAEIVEISEMIWGPRQRWPEWQENERAGRLIDWEPTASMLEVA